MGFQSQAFGGNSAAYAPLKGHSGEDYVVGFRKPIHAIVTAPIYSILNQFNPDPQKYRAIFQIYDELGSDTSYEVSYGHISETLFKEGDIPKAGETIASEGNFGFCMVAGKTVTAEEKPSGKGSHLHQQVRKCKRVGKRAKGKTYLRNSEGFLKRNGQYYEVVNYDNGFNGCVSPVPFYIQPKMEFPKNMELGDNNENVKVLQEALRIYGTFNSDSTGLYGKITAKAVYEFQKKENIAPLTRHLFNGHYCYEQTRKRLSEIFSG